MSRSALLLATLFATLSMGAVAQDTTGGGTGTNTGTGTTTTDTAPGTGTTDATRGTGTDTTGAGTTTGSDRDGGSFDTFDTNRDDTIDGNEARTGTLRDSRTMDTNRDGTVSREEFEQYRQERQVR